MATKDLSKQVSATYQMLRRGLAVLAFGFPLILPIGAYVIAGLPLAKSLSAYYHLSDPLHPELLGVMRNAFVGILFGVSGFLLAYQGYSKLEDYALNAAGILAIGVAIFPMAWPPVADDHTFSLHGACAILFFVAIAYVCIFRAGDTLPLIKDETLRKKYKRMYQVLGWLMVILPAAAWIVSGLQSELFVEAAGIYVFATYWVVKSREVSRTNLDQRAARGSVRARPQGLGDALKSLPVSTDEGA